MEVCFQSGEGVWSRAGPAHDPLFVVSDAGDNGAAAPEDRIEEIILSEGGVLWGMGPTPSECLDEIRRLGAGADPIMRQRAAAAYTGSFIIDQLGAKVLDAMMTGRDPGPVASIRKALSDPHAQHLLTLVKDLAGPAGMIGEQDEHAEETDEWHWAYLFSRALTIGGGTSEIQRNILGEQLLGLPREPRPAP